MTSSRAALLIVLLLIADISVRLEQPQPLLLVLHRGRGRRLRLGQEVPVPRVLQRQSQAGQAHCLQHGLRIWQDSERGMINLVSTCSQSYQASTSVNYDSRVAYIYYSKLANYYCGVFIWLVTDQLQMRHHNILSYDVDLGLYWELFTRTKPSTAFSRHCHVINITGKGRTLPNENFYP